MRLFDKMVIEAEKIQKMVDNGEIDKYEQRDLEEELMGWFEEQSMME